MDQRHLDTFSWFRRGLLWAAYTARQHAVQLGEKVNHRKFHVGAAALMWNGEEYRVPVGANWMPVKGGPKICAEQAAVQNGRDYGYDFVVGLAVVGKPQPDDMSGLIPDTLHLCHGCRVWSIEQGFDFDMPIVTAYFVDGIPDRWEPREPLLLAREEYTLRELLILHRELRAP